MSIRGKRWTSDSHNTSIHLCWVFECPIAVRGAGCGCVDGSGRVFMETSLLVPLYSVPWSCFSDRTWKSVKQTAQILVEPSILLLECMWIVLALAKSQ